MLVYNIICKAYQNTYIWRKIMKEYIINNVEEIREELIDLSKKIWKIQN